MKMKADKLLSADFQQMLDTIIDRYMPKERQLLMFSATFPQSVETFTVGSHSHTRSLSLSLSLIGLESCLCEIAQL